jgi:hypothetical protein
MNVKWEISRHGMFVHSTGIQLYSHLAWLSHTIPILGVRGSVVVKALCYKLEGRGFDSR